MSIFITILLLSNIVQLFLVIHCVVNYINFVKDRTRFKERVNEAEHKAAVARQDLNNALALKVQLEDKYLRLLEEHATVSSWGAPTSEGLK